MIPSLQTLGKSLRRTPIAPTSVAALLERHEIVLAFQTIVRQIVPEAETEIWQARDTGGNRENARVWAFLHRVEAEFFPVYELGEYEQVVCGIPFVRNAWDDERFHALDVPLGELLLMALCAFPIDEDGLRIPVLDLSLMIRETSPSCSRAPTTISHFGSPSSLSGYSCSAKFRMHAAIGTQAAVETGQSGLWGTTPTWFASAAPPLRLALPAARGVRRRSDPHRAGTDRRGPGIGVELAPDAAEKHPYRMRWSGTRLDKDGSVRDQ